jgi:hypothetical protein
VDSSGGVCEVPSSNPSTAKKPPKTKKESSALLRENKRQILLSLKEMILYLVSLLKV